MQLKLFSEQQSVCVGGAATAVGMLAVSGLETVCSSNCVVNSSQCVGGAETAVGMLAVSGL